MLFVCSTCGHGHTDPSNMPSALTEPENLLARPKPGFTPSVYRFRQADDTITEEPRTFEALDLNLIIAQVTQYRFENKYPPIPYLKELILDYTMRSDPAYAPYIEYYQSEDNVHVAAKQYVFGALAYLRAKFMTDEELFVDQELAESRAKSCLNCPRHVYAMNGYTVDTPSLAQSKFAKLAKDRHTSVDNALKICGVCTCLTKAKVHFTLPFIKSASTQKLLQMFKQQYIGLNGKPHRCWIGEEQLQEAQATKK